MSSEKWKEEQKRLLVIEVDEPRRDEYLVLERFMHEAIYVR